MTPELAWEGFAPSGAIGGLLIAVFALAVGILARFRGAAKHYVFFGVGFGIAAFLGHVINAMQTAVGIPFNAALVTEADYTAEMLRFAIPLHLLSAAGYAVAVWGVVGLLRTYHGWHPHLALTGFSASATQVIVLSVFVTGTVAGWPFANAAARALDLMGLHLLVAVLATGSISLARAYARDRHPNQALLGAALATYPVLNGMWIFAGLKIGGTGTGWLLWVPLVFAAWILAAWQSAARQTQERGPRNVVRFVVVAAVIAVAMSPFPEVLHMGGVARVLDILIIAYAILRYQYLGLDVKIRWGISKTTIAALFVAVFFVVSELAANMFSEKWGTEIGIAAAGALVFAIAPIMSWADRIAQAAVPSTTLDHEGIYLASLRVALRDGTIDEAEEAGLAELADKLQLSFATERGLRRQVMQEP